MNEEEMLSLGELEQDIKTLQEFLKKEEPKAAELEEPKELETAAEPEIVAEAPKPKAKSKPKAKKVEDEAVKPTPTPTPVQVKTEAPPRLYGAARLRAKRGR